MFIHPFDPARNFPTFQFFSVKFGYCFSLLCFTEFGFTLITSSSDYFSSIFLNFTYILKIKKHIICFILLVFLNNKILQCYKMFSRYNLSLIVHRIPCVML